MLYAFVHIPTRGNIHALPLLLKRISSVNIDSILIGSKVILADWLEWLYLSIKLPGEVVKFKDTALLEEVDGKAATGGILCGVADEYLPAKGVANNDIFWVVVSGPTAIVTSATVAAGAGLTATAGKAAASDPAKPAERIGFALKAPADGKVRALVGPWGQHSA